jgi:hypothetical protein
MVDHADKRGALNGAAGCAGAADLVMALRPAGPRAVCGNARFEIHFEKTRQRAPLMPILAELQTENGAATWRWDTGAGRVERLAVLVRRGLSRRDVCEALGIERSWFFRLKAEAPRARAAAAEGPVMSGPVMSGPVRSGPRQERAPQERAQARGLRAARHDRSRFGQRRAGRADPAGRAAPARRARGPVHQPHAGASPPRHRQRHAVEKMQEVEAQGRQLRGEGAMISHRVIEAHLKRELARRAAAAAGQADDAATPQQKLVRAAEAGRFEAIVAAAQPAEPPKMVTAGRSARRAARPGEVA